MPKYPKNAIPQTKTVVGNQNSNIQFAITSSRHYSAQDRFQAERKPLLIEENLKLAKD